MYRDILRNKVFGKILALSFGVSVVLIGFSAYTSKAMSKKVAPNIYSTASQVQSVDIAYIPHIDSRETNENHLRFAPLIKDLYSANLIQHVLCESPDLKNQLDLLGVPVHLVPNTGSRIHLQVQHLLSLTEGQSVLVVAEKSLLEQELYAFWTNGTSATGLAVSPDKAPSILPKYLSRVQLYLDSKVSKPNPLISNPRYTLDIQH